MLDARARGLLLSMLLGHGLHDTPSGRRMIEAFDAAMDAAVLPFIVTDTEAMAIRTMLSAGVPTHLLAVYGQLVMQTDEAVNEGPLVLRASVSALRALWLHHVGISSPESTAICRAVERSGALQVGVFTGIADVDVDTIAQALPMQTSIMFRTLLGDHAVAAAD